MVRRAAQSLPRGRDKLIPETLGVVLSQEEYDRIHKMQATQEQELADLRQVVEGMRTPAAPLVETPQELRWYLCPQCHGTGQMRRPANVKRPTRWVGFKDHVPCSVCQGTKSVHLVINDPQVRKLALLRQCPKCQNWYAVGAGKPEDEPCYQRHAQRKGVNTCCHWHDLSMSPPGEPVEFIGDLPSPWEEELFKVKQELVTATR